MLGVGKGLDEAGQREVLSCSGGCVGGHDFAAPFAAPRGICSRSGAGWLDDLVSAARLVERTGNISRTFSPGFPLSKIEVQA